jgi:hypothetical protein
MIEHILEMNREIHLEEFNNKYKSLGMKHYLLIDDNNDQLDHVWATLAQAEYHFFTKQGWTRGSIYTLEEYQDQLNLDAYENQYM